MKDVPVTLTDQIVGWVLPVRGPQYDKVWVLKTYCELSVGQIKKIKGLKTRMATVYRNYPQFILTEQNLYILNDESE